MSTKEVGGLEVAQGVPYFVFDVHQEALTHPGVYAAVSVQAHSPILDPSGAQRLVSYLDSLPHTSLLIVADTLRRHDIIAMKKMKNKYRGLCMDEARRLALEHGNAYVEAIGKAVNVVGTDKITVLRWDDVMDENKMKQKEIAQRHYRTNPIFRERVDELAMEFLRHRNPNGRFTTQRMPHLTEYVLEEFPIGITGVAYNGERYRTNIYATSERNLARIVANPKASTLWSLANDVRKDPMFEDLRNEMIEADDGVKARNGAAVFPVSSKPM